MPVVASPGRVVITTRSMDDELYALAAALFPEHPKRRLMGRSAEGYLEEVLALEDADWVLNIDEDAFVTDRAAVCDLILLMDREGYDYCGVSDGGVIPHRNNSPLVVNPFFNVFHVARIRDRLAGVETTDLPINTLSTAALGLDVEPSRLHYVEPFDSLLTWLSQCFRPLYLTARTHADGITTIVSSPDGRDLMIHTWYSRMFRTDLTQRRRIQARIREAYLEAGETLPVWSQWRDPTDWRIRSRRAWVHGRRTLRRGMTTAQRLASRASA